MKRLLICVVATALTSTAFAGDYGTLDLSLLGRPGPDQGDGGRFDFSINDDSQLNLPTGYLLKKYDSPTNNGGNDVYAFCVELTQSAGSAVFDVDKLTTHISAARAANLEKLGDHYWDLGALTGNGTGTYNDNEQAGAFQLVVWDIVVGDNDGVVGEAGEISGTFSADAIALGNTWAASLAGLSDVKRTLMVWLANGVQDQVTITCVPEAGSLLAFASVAGAIGLVMYRRRK